MNSLVSSSAAMVATIVLAVSLSWTLSTKPTAKKLCSFLSSSQDDDLHVNDITGKFIRTERLSDSRVS